MYTSGLGNDASVTQHFATIQWIRIVENCMECSALQVSITIVLDFPTHMIAKGHHKCDS